ncbi:hypothetical protein CcaCcLH18_04319 [Colletotrichum camelliae]|nr:hypothetical protein CcaCcLH18_04319 [Colletotrichum camelliae]
MDLYDNQDIWSDKDTYPEVKKAIGTCLDVECGIISWKNQGEARDALQKHVIWLQGNNISSSIQSSQERHDLTPSVETATFRKDPNFSSRSWFDQLDKFNDIVGAGQIDGSDTSVGIAILDTGISPSIVSALIRGYKDFVDDSNLDRRDNTGHGSKCFRLLRNVYNKAQVYIGRVWETNVEGENTASLLATAIDNAVTSWKVNVIIIPSGFQDPHQGVERAIDYANERNALVFAAASNYGNLPMERIAYPARLYTMRKVFCMFGSDSNARCLPAFNPSPQKSYDNFAILGENIVLGDDRPVSGTSFSTVLGAGLAGRIIDFSRQSDSNIAIKSPANLLKVEGMTMYWAMKETQKGQRIGEEFATIFV